MKSMPLVVLALLIASPVSAQELLPAPKSQGLPAPRSVPLPQERIYFERYAGPQVGRRNVWELVIPDSRGFFVDRVIAAPGVPYYLSDGRPYPWTTTSSLPYMSYATD